MAHRNEVCSVSFYDRSRNNSAVWHDSSASGNAIYLRASWARKRQGELSAEQRRHHPEEPRDPLVGPGQTTDPSSAINVERENQLAGVLAAEECEQNVREVDDVAGHDVLA
jgi:hypothetical protein